MVSAPDSLVGELTIITGWLFCSFAAHQYNVADDESPQPKGIQYKTKYWSITNPAFCWAKTIRQHTIVV